jgi:alcohol dehydrogenase (cytochrome c)
MYRRTYDGAGYSPLDQITKENVRNLQFAWSSFIAAGAVQVTPIVYQGVLYLPQPGDTIEAYNAKTGDRLWTYARELPKDVDATPLYVQRTTRNIAIYQDKIYHATADGYVIALDAKTGKLVWETQVGDYKQMTHVAGPLVIRDKVITGRACATTATEGCFIVAHNTQTGSEVWRRTLVPKAGEAGWDTWGSVADEKRQQAGAWLVGSYDSELDLLFWGTSVPFPLSEQARGSGAAELAYTNATLAMKPDTGEIVWSRQHLPRDNWGMDHAYERLVLKTEVSPDASAVKWINPRVEAGHERKVITGVPGKTGLVWTLDAASGEFLWARETIGQNIIRDIDKETGKPILNEAVIPKVGSVNRVCPSYLGGKHWAASAYAPELKAMYIPLVNACMDVGISGEEITTQLKPAANQPDRLGVLEAISVSTGQTLWRYVQHAPIGAVLTTAGRVVFAGDLNRRFRAFDAENGKVLWETVTSGPVTGTPISYMVEGKQYIAIALGGGTDIEKLLELTPDLRPGAGGNALFVFSLPD